MNRKSDKLILIDILEKMGIQLSEEQTEQFLVYYQFLLEKNKVMNLTAITEYRDVVQKHFADSLSIINAYDMNTCSCVIDVGTGAGFPGLPLKIAYPHLKVVLLDSLKKRIVFLNELIEKLSLRDITAVHARAEDAARDKNYREQFDLCVSRAVANLSSLSEYCLPFVKKGGTFISYKSTNIDTEIENSGHAITVLGGKIEGIEKFLLPGTDIARALVAVKKIKTTPSGYPRKAGLPSKEPL